MMYEKIKIQQNVLLLQGPMGDFFKVFASFLCAHGVEVYKINLHLGEHYFYHGSNVTLYRGDVESWSSYIEKYMIDHGVQQVFLLGTQKIYHGLAIGVAKKLNIEVYVFEEGYIRPDYITLEKDGVNGDTNLPHDVESYLRYHVATRQEILPEFTLPVWRRVLRHWWCAYAYSWGVGLTLLCNPAYRHHVKIYSVPTRALIACTVWQWIKALLQWNGIYITVLVRKFFSLKFIANSWLNRHTGRYYAVPLQVNTDAAIQHYASESRMEMFIKAVIESFAQHASFDKFLVIKHHPHDVILSNYKGLIQSLAKKHNLVGRIKYIHDAHIPTFLSNACGCVVVNSTMGLSALSHGVPTYAVAQNAIYNLPGLTNQGTLDEFWVKSEKPSSDLYKKFISYVVYNTQMRGSFYGGVKNDFEEKFEFKSG